MRTGGELMRDRVLLWGEAVAAFLSGLAFLATVLQRDWIEHWFGIDADGGNGALEWVIAVALLALAVALAVLARRQWRHLLAAS
jgi:hypothetical protein